MSTVFSKRNSIIEEINNAIDDRKNFYFSSCLCGRGDNFETLYLHDRYGVSIPQILCSQCGLIRSKFFMTEAYASYFYKNLYRDLYTAPSLNLINFFEDQKNRGKIIANFLKKNSFDLKNKSVLEVGCGAGGILQALKDEGAHVIGCDWNDEYLNFGKMKGLNLAKGDFQSLQNSEKYDLIILCHVLEHFSSPVKELTILKSFLKDNGLLYIEVPGIFRSYKYYYNPRSYFQSAHCYNFTSAQLNALCSHAQLISLTSNEEIHALYKLSTILKPLPYPELSQKISFYWKNQKCFWRYRINPYYWLAIFKRYLKKLSKK